MHFNDIDIHVYGRESDPRTLRVRRVLEDEGATFWFINTETDKASAALVRRLNGGKKNVPTVICPDGAVLAAPDENTLRSKARAIEMSRLPMPTMDYSYSIV